MYAIISFTVTCYKIKAPLGCQLDAPKPTEYQYSFKIHHNHIFCQLVITYTVTELKTIIIMNRNLKKLEVV